MPKTAAFILLSFLTVTSAFAEVNFSKTFEASLGVGPVIPATEIPYTDFAGVRGKIKFNMGFGYYARFLVKITRAFALGAAVSKTSFGSSEPFVLSYGTFQYKHARMDYLGVVKFTPTQGKAKPYFLACLGSSGGELTLEQAAGLIPSSRQLVFQPGIGVSMTRRRVSLFLEMKCAFMRTDGESLSYLPITAGLQF